MKKGFTFIEIIIVLAILLLITLFVFVSFSSLRQNQLLNGTTENVSVFINEARSRTLASKDFSQYGIHFEASRIVVFKGTTFSEPNPENHEFSFPQSIEISNIALNGGGINLIFQKLTGKTDQFGSVTLRVKSDPSKTKTIIINATGITNVQ